MTPEYDDFSNAPDCPSPEQELLTAIRKARREAYEDAAKYIESRAYPDGMIDEEASELASAIRARMVNQGEPK
jgi:FKBP-type peptidyl-prolyl cis-trans isomerase (trigger factor)